MSIKPHLYWNHQQDLENVASLLQAGEVIVGSSDTILGLFATVSSKGYQSLNSIKHRTDKPYLILLDHPSALAQYTPMPLHDWVHALINQFWPGPLTIIVRAHKRVPDWIRAHDGTIAVRVPHHQGIQALAARVGPLFSTSANLAGKPVPKHIHDIDPDIMDKVAATIDDEQQPLLKPSTIVDCTGDFPIVVREGAIPAIKIMAI